MSAFLGPIHYWLYRKIQLQEALINTILETSAQEGWEMNAEKLNTACGAADFRPLEEVIDQGNIHGWLHQRIGVSEVRLAYLVTELLKADAARLDTLKNAAYRFGERHAMVESVDATAAYKMLEDTLLNGMPCDHVNKLLEQSADRVVWQQTQCVHKEYWERVGGDVTVYNALRARMTAGLIAQSALRFNVLADDKFEIVRG